MKVKFLSYGTEQEMVLSDGKRISAQKNESKEAFVKRVEKIVKEDYLEDEMQIVEIDPNFASKFKTEQLQTAYEKAEGLQAKMISIELKSRGVVVGAKAAPKAESAPSKLSKAENKVANVIKEEAAKAKAEAATKAKEDAAKAKAEKAEAAAKAKQEKAEAAAKAKAEKAEARAKAKAEKQPAMSLEEAEALKETWNTHKGAVCSFVPYSDAKAIEATIIGVVVDKRVNMTLVRLKDEAKKLYHKIPSALTIVTPAPEKVDKAALKEAKEAERKAKAEEAAKAKQEKAEAAAKAKAEKAEAAAKAKQEKAEAAAKAKQEKAEAAAKAKAEKAQADADKVAAKAKEVVNK